MNPVIGAPPDRRLALLALVVPLLALPAVLRPEIALLLIGGSVVVAAAWISPAIPLGLAGMAAWFAPVLGVAPPEGSVVVGLGGWVALSLLFALRRRASAPPFESIAWVPLGLAVMLAAAMLWRLGGPDAAAYGQQKLIIFLLSGVVFAAAAAIVGSHRRDLEILLWLVAGVATFASVVLIFQLLTGLEPVLPSRYTIAGTENPIELGQQATLGILICGWMALARPGLARLAAVAALPPLGIALVASGSRGPLLGLIAGAAVLAVLLRREGVVSISLPAGLVAGGAVAATMALAPGNALGRLLGVLTGGQGGQDVSGRQQLWDLAIDNFAAETVVGLGTGGFVGVAPTDNSGYPHNFVLEAAVELGVIGLILALATIVFGAWAILVLARRARRAPIGAGAVVAAYFAAAIVFAMISGDIGINNQVWLSLGLLAAVVAGDVPAPVARPQRR